MKTTRLLLAILAIVLFSNIIKAGNPKNVENEKLSNDMLSKLSKDIVLTDSQKTAIALKMNDFLLKRQVANGKNSDMEKAKYRNESYSEYKSALDSLLSTDQKMTLKTKKDERKHNK